MPRLAVVSYPVLEPDDGAWIESIRAQYDPQAALLAAHVTLVFPADIATADALRDVSAVAGRHNAIPFTVRWARPVRDVFGAGGHVFLVPDEGFDLITALHADLYRSVFAPSKREDIPFVPHITVAASADFSECERVAQGMMPLRRLVRGSVAAVSLVEITANAVRILEEVPLL